MVSQNGDCTRSEDLLRETKTFSCGSPNSLREFAKPRIGGPTGGQVGHRSAIIHGTSTTACLRPRRPNRSVRSTDAQFKKTIADAKSKALSNVTVCKNRTADILSKLNREEEWQALVESTCEAISSEETDGDRLQKASMKESNYHYIAKILNPIHMRMPTDLMIALGPAVGSELEPEPHDTEDLWEEYSEGNVREHKCEILSSQTASSLSGPLSGGMSSRQPSAVESLGVEANAHATMAHQHCGDKSSAQTERSLEIEPEIREQVRIAERACIMRELHEDLEREQRALEVVKDRNTELKEQWESLQVALNMSNLRVKKLNKDLLTTSAELKRVEALEEAEFPEFTAEDGKRSSSIQSPMSRPLPLCCDFHSADLKAQIQHENELVKQRKMENQRYQDSWRWLVDKHEGPGKLRQPNYLKRVPKMLDEREVRRIHLHHRWKVQRMLAGLERLRMEHLDDSVHLDMMCMMSPVSRDSVRSLASSSTNNNTHTDSDWGREESRLSGREESRLSLQQREESRLSLQQREESRLSLQQHPYWETKDS